MANKLSKRYFGQTGVDAVAATNTGPKLPIRVYNGSVKEGYIVNQVGARRFKCADDTVVQDEDIVLGNQYVIVSIGGTDFTQFGALDNKVGRIFTATSAGAALGNGTAYRLITAKLVQGTNSDPTAANTATLVGIVAGAGQRPVTLKKINFRTAVDFSGNRYKWSLQDDSSQTLLLLTQI
jgi:hypothetical protein